MGRYRHCKSNHNNKIIYFFLLGGAKVNIPSNNNEEDTPLHTAARFGVPELVALYLAHGASVDAVNSFQETPLMTAAFWTFDAKEQICSEDHHLVCRLLLDHNAGERLWISFIVHDFHW